MGKNDEKEDRIKALLEGLFIFMGIGFIISYLFISFVVSDFNFLNWDSRIRFLCALSTVILGNSIANTIND